MCLSRSGIIARAVRVPKMSLADLETHMELEANEYIPVSFDEYCFDYRLMSEITDDELDYYNILAAATLKTQVEECVSIIETAGLRPLAVDIFPNVIWATCQ